MLKQSPHGDGSLKVSFSEQNQQSTHKVHHLVLEAFVGPRLDGTEACHNNGNAMDNRLSNLRWDTHENNIADKRVHGTNQEGERNAYASLSWVIVDQIREEYGSPDWSLSQRRAAGLPTMRDLAEKYGTDPSQIHRIVRRLGWNNGK